jgi:hypothetical protein
MPLPLDLWRLVSACLPTNTLLRGVCCGLRDALEDELWPRGQFERFLRSAGPPHACPRRLVVVLDAPIACVRTKRQRFDVFDGRCITIVRSDGPQFPAECAARLEHLTLDATGAAFDRDNVYHLMHLFEDRRLDRVRDLVLRARHQARPGPYTMDLCPVRGGQRSPHTADISTSSRISCGTRVPACVASCWTSAATT